MVWRRTTERRWASSWRRTHPSPTPVRRPWPRGWTCGLPRLTQLSTWGGTPRPAQPQRDVTLWYFVPDDKYMSPSISQFKLELTQVLNERKIKGQANQLIHNEAGNTMLETDASNTDCSNKTEEAKVDIEWKKFVFSWSLWILEIDISFHFYL